MARPRLRNDELRGRLLDGALQLVEQGGVAALTTRAVAASADSSMSAVHELFGGKPGLIRAMFVEGFARLAADYRALPVTDDAQADVMALTLAFRQFAVTNRQLFDVMFSRPFAEFEPDLDDMQAAADVHRVVMRRITALLGSHTSRAVRHDVALSITAVMQGLAHMELAGILGSHAASIERRWRQTVAATVRGLTTTER
jgi:AcrR family transcriptional regulator